MPPDRDLSFLQVQEAKYCLMEIFVTLSSHPSKRAECFPFVTILMALKGPEMLFEVSLLVGPVEMDD